MAVDYASLIPSIVGLGLKTGAAIPALRKPKKVQHRSQATRLGGQIQGASQAGFGASRGLALREGLRAGAEATKQIAAADAQAQQNVNAFNVAQSERRGQRLAEFGADLAKGLGDMAAISVGGPDGDTPGTSAVRMKANTPEAQAQAMQTLGPDQRPEEDPVNMAPQTLGVSAEEIASDIQQNRAEQADQAAAGDPSVVGPTADMSMVDGVIAGRNPNLVPPEVENELALTLNIRDLALAQAERMGINPLRASALLTKRLGLQPGQSSQNPWGISLYPDDEGL